VKKIDCLLYHFLNECVFRLSEVVNVQGTSRVSALLHADGLSGADDCNILRKVN
jgi:hypothetical protein